jgi:hypothetical protein
MREAVRSLVTRFPRVSDDLDGADLEAASELIDSLVEPLSHDEIVALIGIMPAAGDTASGLNWTFLHAVEASPDWPIWSALADLDHGWVKIFRIRLKNAGYVAPEF